MPSENRTDPSGTLIEEAEQRLMPAPTRGFIVAACLTAGAVALLLGAAYLAGRAGTLHAVTAHPAGAAAQPVVGQPVVAQPVVGQSPAQLM